MSYYITGKTSRWQYTLGRFGVCDGTGWRIFLPESEHWLLNQLANDGLQIQKNPSTGKKMGSMNDSYSIQLQCS